MTKPFSLISLSLLLLLLGSCRKDPEIKEPKATDSSACDAMYLSRSKPYTNLFTGDIIMEDCLDVWYDHPEQYQYHTPVANPNNPHEILYTRFDNDLQGSLDKDLYVFNFCTGKAKLLAEHVAYLPEWTVKDWISFYKQGGMWKIKPNGDSLTKMKSPASGPFYIYWNTTGTLYFYDFTTIANEEAQTVYTIPHCGQFIGWYDSLNILNSRAPAYHIVYKTNVSTGVSEVFTEIPEGYFATAFDRKKMLLFCNKNANRMTSYLVFNIKTSSVEHDLGWKAWSTSYFVYYGMNNKLLINLGLTDTLSEHECTRNYRNHVAIMNMDGTDLRQVMLP